MNLFDAIVLGVLALFALWGAVRGPLRTVLALGVLAGSVPAATWGYEGLVEWSSRITGLVGASAVLVAWLSALAAAWLAGALILRLLAPLLEKAPKGGLVGRGFGAALGCAQGALLLVLLVHAGFGRPDEGGSALPPLAKPEGLQASASASAPKWTAVVRASQSLPLLLEAGRQLESWVDLPGAVRVWIEDARRAADP